MWGEARKDVWGMGCERVWGEWLPVTSPQKLRHMATLPYFQKVRRDVGRNMKGSVRKSVGVWGR